MHPTSDRLDDTVSHWLQALAKAEPDGVLPDPQVIWWRAQALRRLDQQRRLAALLDVDERVQLGCGTLAAVLLLVYSINVMPLAFALFAAGCSAVMGIVVALSFWDARRSLQ